MSSIAVNTITDASGGNSVSINSYTPTASNMAGRNRIINGDMMIDQRNAGASVTPTSATYSLDRWNSQCGNASSYSLQQSSTAPTGLIKSLLVTSLAATTVTSADSNTIEQYVEGLNCSDLAWGTANAKTVTISFWVRSSLTGTFGGCVQNSDNTRSYVFSYTISAANTWEQKTVTIAGDTSGTWLTTNGIGIKLRFSIGNGSSLQTTAGSWSGSNYRTVTGETQVLATNGATFYITGVQLEEGSVATPFEHRQYGAELALCQRYYWKMAVASVYESYVLRPDWTRIFQLPFKQTMRSAPTATYTYDSDGTGATLGSVILTTDYLRVSTSATSVSNADPRFLAFAVSAEL